LARLVIIADDLTGAADCAASSAALGCRATVILHSLERREPDASWPDTDIVSIDTNSRSLSEGQASDLIGRLALRCDAHRTESPGYILYKKIDSTLRGNVAAELAALLRARRSLKPGNAKPSILMAPSLPAQGRTTVGGRLLVRGVPLEKTDIWKAEASPAESNILKLLATAGLSCGLIDAETVRSGSTRLRHAISQSAKYNDVIICDAETDDDLCAIAASSLGEPAITVWVGSAGLATQISQAIGIAPDTELHKWDFQLGSTLFVVGTASSVTREQVRTLAANPEIAIFHAAPPDLRHSSTMNAKITQSLQSGRDVLLTMDGGEGSSMLEKRFRSDEFTDLVSECGQFLGGLVATGGETARAILDALGIHRLRLVGEVEPGLPFSVADDRVRPLPVITKAGAFGSLQSLVRCREFLSRLERVPADPQAKDLFLNHKSLR